MKLSNVLFIIATIAALLTVYQIVNSQVIHPGEEWIWTQDGWIRAPKPPKKLVDKSKEELIKEIRELRREVNDNADRALSSFHDMTGSVGVYRAMDPEGEY